MPMLLPQDTCTLCYQQRAQTPILWDDNRIHQACQDCVTRLVGYVPFMLDMRRDDPAHEPIRKEYEP